MTHDIFALGWVTIPPADLRRTGTAPGGADTGGGARSIVPFRRHDGGSCGHGGNQLGRAAEISWSTYRLRRVISLSLMPFQLVDSGAGQAVSAIRWTWRSRTPHSGPQSNATTYGHGVGQRRTSVTTPLVPAGRLAQARASFVVLLVGQVLAGPGRAVARTRWWSVAGQLPVASVVMVCRVSRRAVCWTVSLPSVRALSCLRSHAPGLNAGSASPPVGRVPLGGVADHSVGVLVVLGSAGALSGSLAG
ncbi:hypothetical protein FB465_7195 [Kitasatospora atroaurantiaca]|uniref:Uncharacterized protein n=1 Tax=Kitasatospora atroaurantiaca TaxID=285545 RepID=A0A561EHQ3_9ACTN|nr:hypothetical protein FB465_0011 [Kitasatospora atroaurantiaca]TWE21938.1 hypothetical protein FB465_7195 [Kitasatospora atroaurantiaca]